MIQNIFPQLELERDEFYKSLGQAVAQWQQIEANLSGLCGSAVGAMNRLGFAAVFYQTKGFAARVEMVEQAVSYSKSSADSKSRWKSLRSELSSAAKTRNEMVHGTVVYITDGSGYVLAKDSNNPKHGAAIFSDKPGLTKEAMADFAKISNDLQSKLRDLEVQMEEELLYPEDVYSYDQRHATRQ